jgi:hypothetical protein
MAEPVHLGFPGTVNAQQQATWLPAVGGARFGVVAPDDLEVVRNTGLDRGISINGGRIWGDGVYSIFDETVPAATFALPAPAAGTTRWHMVVARRDWQNPYTLTFPAIDAGPTAALAARENNPGVTSDQPLALVEVIAGQSAVGQIIDLRCWNSGTLIIAKDERVKGYLAEIGAVLKVGRIKWTYEDTGNSVFDWVLEPGPFAMAAGADSFTMNGSATTTKAVTFPPGRFTAPPIITLGKAMSGRGEINFFATNQTTTGFTLGAQTTSGAASVIGVACNWTAVQMTPTSGAG